VEDGTESYFPEFKRATLEMIRAQAGSAGPPLLTKSFLVYESKFESWRIAGS
jgi:hypothetical protein